MIYFFAMLMPMMLMQNMTMTENYKAAWIFFALPVERSRLLLAVRNSILISFILPYLILLCVVFSYFMPALHAIKHVIVLGAIGNFVFQGYLWGQARMPFAQQRRPNQRGVAQFAGMFIFMILPMGLLILDMYFGYKSELRYWSGLALILTISVIVERFMQSRIERRLDREEFAG
jgi:ABC-2 type transport system permease protein